MPASPQVISSPRPDEETDAGRRSSSWIPRLGIGFVVVAAGLRLGVAWRRFLQVDEMQILHLAWLRSDGSVPGKDHAFPQFSLLIDALEALWIFLGESLNGIFAARTCMWLVSLGVLFLLWLFVRRILDGPAAIGSVIALSTFTSFNDRIIEIRSDGLLVLLWLGSFALLTARQYWATYAAGFLAAVSVAFNFKSLAALPFLGVAALVPPTETSLDPVDSVARGFRFCAGLTGGSLAYLAFLAVREDIGLYAKTIVRNLAVSAAEGSRFSLATPMTQSLFRNPIFYAIAVFGLYILVTAHSRRAPLWIPPLLFSVTYLWLNPTFYPYNFVDVGPFWAIPAGAVLASTITRFRPAVPVLLLVLLLAFPLYRLVFLLQPTLDDQLAVNRFVMETTSPDDRVYDGSGLVLFRRGPFHWRLHSLMLPRYRMGEFRLSQELVARPCRIFVPSYRTRWLTEQDRHFLAKAFVLFPRERLGLQGWTVEPEDWTDGTVAIPILQGGPFRLFSSVPMSIDERPFEGTVMLDRGVHELSGTPARAGVAWSPRNLEAAMRRLPSNPRLFFDFDY